MSSMVRAVELGEWDEKRLGELLLDLSLGELKLELPELTGFDPAEIDLRITGLETASDPAGPIQRMSLRLSVRRSRQRVTAGWPGTTPCCAAMLSSPPVTRPCCWVGSRTSASPTCRSTSTSTGTSAALAIDHRRVRHGRGRNVCGRVRRLPNSGDAAHGRTQCRWLVHFHAMDWGHAHEMLVAGRRVYERLLNLCVWCKDNGGMGSMYRSQHELFFVWKKGTTPHTNNIQLGQYGRNQTNVWQYPGCNSFSRTTEEGNLLEIHPTCKPVALVADALLDASVRGDIALIPLPGPAQFSSQRRKSGGAPGLSG